VTTFVYGDHILTYFNYFGVLIAFIFFGSRIFSLDKLVSGAKGLAEKYRGWDIALIRITYGISVIYPAIMIKILHPIIMVEIAKKYHLADIRWLFPSDPLLISLGTGLTQIAVGLFIILGFGTRLSSFATFILYVLSIIYFKEAVWPHYILLALALYLVINDGGKLTVDEWLKKKIGRANPQPDAGAAKN
ncbi:MAG: TQO small subunit DoxD, partial [Candidatus Liptonbacteria bacterium]|nr:TQO small subunit DoxD [Candidatus Liptonbacteria bacterium]